MENLEICGEHDPKGGVFILLSVSCFHICVISTYVELALNFDLVTVSTPMILIQTYVQDSPIVCVVQAL